MKKSFISLMAVYALSGLLYAGGDMVAVEEPVVEVPMVVDESAWYVGIGFSSMSIDNDFTKEEFSTNAVMFQGGYQYNRYIALEARYWLNVGDLDYEHGRTINEDISDYPGDFTNGGIYLKPMYPVDNFSLYALLGYGQLEVTNIPPSTIGVNAGDREERAIQWGLGASYDFSETMSAFMDYVRMYDDVGLDGRAQNSDVLADAWTFGFTYKF